MSNPIFQIIGFISSIAFLIQYLPQIYLNFEKKSVKGFSSQGIIIKLVGSSFLLVNSLWSNGIKKIQSHFFITI